MTPKLGSHAHKGLVHDPYELGATGVARTRRMGTFITMIKATFEQPNFAAERCRA
jgi:hypothetical protein